MLLMEPCLELECFHSGRYIILTGQDEKHRFFTRMVGSWGSVTYVCSEEYLVRYLIG